MTLSIPVVRAGVGIAISVALLALAVRNVDLRDVVHHLGRTRIDALAAAMVLGATLVWWRGVRWGYFFHPERPGSTGLATATMIGYMWNIFLPLRAGEVVRVYLAARRERLPFWTVMATLALERILDVVVIAVLLAGVVFVAPVPTALQTGAIGLVALDAAVLAAIVVLSRRPRLAAAVLGRLPLGGGARTALARWLGQFTEGVRCVATGPHVVPLLAWTLVIWTLNVLTVWLTMAASRLDLPAGAALLVLVFTGIGMAVPSGPGYVGTLEFFVVIALAVYGVGEGAALSFAVLLRAAAFVPVIVVGAGLVLREQLSLSAVTRAARAEASAGSATP